MCAWQVCQRCSSYTISIRWHKGYYSGGYFVCDVHCGSDFNLPSNTWLRNDPIIVTVGTCSLFLISVFRDGTRTSRSGVLKWKYAKPLGFAVVPLTISTSPCVRHSAFAYLTEQRVKYCLLPAIKMDGTLFFFLWENMCSGVWGVMVDLATNISNHYLTKKKQFSESLGQTWVVLLK